jgi:hypothetical protein
MRNRLSQYLQGRKMDSEQSNTRNDGPQDSTSAVTTDFGNWRSQESLSGSMGMDKLTIDKFGNRRMMLARSA